ARDDGDAVLHEHGAVRAQIGNLCRLQDRHGRRERAATVGEVPGVSGKAPAAVRGEASAAVDRSWETTRGAVCARPGPQGKRSSPVRATAARGGDGERQE